MRLEIIRHKNLALLYVMVGRLAIIRPILLSLVNEVKALSTLFEAALMLINDFLIKPFFVFSTAIFCVTN